MVGLGRYRWRWWSRCKALVTVRFFPLLVILGAVVLIGRRVFQNILPVQRIRVDPSGDGHFGSGRFGHTHQGVDLLAEPGEPVYSPVSGRFIRTGYPYANDRRWLLLVVQGEGVDVKLMYVSPVVGLHPGDPVVRGQLIGHAQGIADKYGAPMLHHIHVEARRVVGGHVLNPAAFLDLDPWPTA